MRMRLVCAAAAGMVMMIPGPALGKGLQSRPLEDRVVAFILAHHDPDPGADRAPAEPGVSGFRRASRDAQSAAGFNPYSLKLPWATFDPATPTSQDWPVSGTSANTVGFRVNHWWAFDRMGMQTGYYQLAGAQSAETGNLIAFGWQGSAFSNSGQAAAAFRDGTSRTGQWGEVYNCQSIVHISCALISYETQDGGYAAYMSFQSGFCLGETKATAEDQQTWSDDQNAIAKIQAALVVVGAQSIQRSCQGGGPAPASRSTAPPTSKSAQPVAASPIQPGFHGSCFAFRGEEWNNAQLTANLIDQWWTALQTAYDNNYPVPSGGSVPGPTQDQVSQAQQAMAVLHRAINNHRAHTGLEYVVVGVAVQYGVNPNQSGPATWAISRLFGALYYLDRASNDEYHQYNTGLDDYHTAQMFMSNTWDALNQLPCKS